MSTATSPWVLVADDDRAVREFLATALRSEGYIAVTAATGPEALDILGEVVPAVIVTDSHMPVVDEPSFLRTYRETDVPHAPVIALRAGPAPAGVPMTELADAILPKPFDLDQLLGLVAQFADR